MSSSTSRAPLLVMLLIGVLWGLNWPAIKFILSELPPITIRAIAFPLAALLLAAIARAKKLPLRPRAVDRLPIALTGVLIIFGFNVLTTIGQTLTATSRAAIIAYTMPALTALLASMFLKERLALKTALALFFGMLGIAVLASENFTTLLARPLGALVMLGAALSWAAGNVLLKSRRWSLSPLALTVWFFVASSVACWPLVLIFESPWQLEMPSASVLWAMLYHILGPMVVCYVLWTAMVERLPATVAAISTLVAPVVGVVSAIVLLDEDFTWRRIVALSMVVLSILLTVSRSSPSTNRTRPEQKARES